MIQATEQKELTVYSVLDELDNCVTRLDAVLLAAYTTMDDEDQSLSCYLTEDAQGTVQKMEKIITGAYRAGLARRNPESAQRKDVANSLRLIDPRRRS